MGQGDLSEDFANDSQKRDAAIVVAIITVTLVLVQGDYVGISPVLGNVTLLPAQAEELMKWLQDGLLPMLRTLWQDTVLPRGLATGETVDGYAELSVCIVGVLSSTSITGNPGRALRAVSVTTFWVA